MKLNRKSVTLGLVGFGLAGALAGGVGIAAAGADPSSPAPGPASTSTSMPRGDEARGLGGVRGGMAFGENSPMSTATSYLGLSQSELRAQLQSGKSLADIAKAQGKSVPGLEAAIVAAVKTNLDANTNLTAQQKTTILQHLNERVATMVETTEQDGAGHGQMHGSMDDMHGMGR
jgi:hypothetical protein